MIPSLATNNSSFQVQKEYLDQYRVFDEQNKTQSMAEMPGPYALLAFEEKNECRNRYRDILPYQQNIFRFQNPNRYFNASCVLQGRAISCQGPLDIEYDHFWRMAWESKTTAVIMLTDLVDKGKTKCSWYLPQEKGDTLPANDELPIEEVIMVTQLDGPPRPDGESPEGFTELIERRLELEYKGEKRIVIHYHLRGWRDFEAAPEVILAELVMRVWKNHFSRRELIIPHCSAGIGRSGTFLAILETFSQLNQMPVLTKDLVFNVVKQLRSLENGREGMVQNINQYGLIFKTLAILNTHCAQYFCTQDSL
jgi:protein tyrosine phosphatase